MQIKYKIIGCSEEERSIIVRFYSDVITEEELADRDTDGEIIRHSDGSIKNCRTDYNINLFAEDFEENFNKASFNLSTIQCPFKKCSCQPDTHITKWQL